MAEETRMLGPDRVVAVATSAIREAANGPAFRLAARDRFGLDIEVVSAAQEAALAYAGAHSELADFGGRLAVIDFGGGSIEIALGTGARCLRSSSVTLGAVRLKDAFQIDGPLDRIEAEAIASMIRMSLAPAAKLVTAHRPERIVFASGTARAVHRLAHAVMGVAELSRVLSYEQTFELREWVIRRTPSELEGHGADPGRADVLGIAVVVIEALMSMLSSPLVEISERGLREGVALRELRRGQAKADAADGLDDARPADLPT
jgi:exopolyphosphatase/guanosine-5'-triphosphate,3'-diphosphate pyrophosphatase